MRMVGILLAMIVCVAGASAVSLRAATIDVTSFGAVPNDGVDDLAAINAAIASAAPGDTISIPPGNFTISGKVLTKSNTRLIGAGEGATTLRWSGTSSTSLLGLANVTNVEVADLTLDGNNSTVPTQGIHGQSASNLNIHDVAVQNIATTTGFAPHAIFFDTNVTNSIIQNDTLTNIGAHSNWGAGIRLGHGSSDNQILSNTIDTTGRGGILVDDNSTDLVIKNNTVTNSGVNGGTGLGIELQGGNDRAVIEDNHIDHWLSIDNSSNLAVRRNVISDTSGTYKYAGIELVDAHDDVFTDNTVNGGQQLGISISGPNPKQRVLFARNAIKTPSTWGIQIQGDSGGASEMYFYKNSFQYAIRNGPDTVSPPQGNGVRFNGNSNHITFDKNTIDSNQGNGVQFSGSSTLSALTFTRNTITNNAQSDYTGTGGTGLVWTNNVVSGNGNNTQPSAPALALADGDPTQAAIEVALGEPVEFSLDSFRAPGLAADSTGYANVLWDFGDGIPSTDFNPTHVWSTPGTYQVTMLAWDASGNGVMNLASVSVIPEPSTLLAVLGLVGLTGRWRNRWWSGR